MAKTSQRVRSPIVCGTDFTAPAASAATVAAGGSVAAGVVSRMRRPVLVVNPEE